MSRDETSAELTGFVVATHEAVYSGLVLAYAAALVVTGAVAYRRGWRAGMAAVGLGTLAGVVLFSTASGLSATEVAGVAIVMFSTGSVIAVLVALLMRRGRRS